MSLSVRTVHFATRVCVALVASTSVFALAQNFSTIAGNGTRGAPTDAVIATSSTVDGPNGLALDRFGNLYIADSNHHLIRKITLDGKISTVVGNGTKGFAGDNAAATKAQINYPTTLAIAANGDLYFADYGNHRVRKVNAADGIVSTVAGNGTEGFAGDGGSATAAQLNNPVGIALTATGELLIADTQNHRIRKVTTNGVISTVAGDGTAGFVGEGVAATTAQFNYPGALLVSPDGSYFVADYANNRVRQISASGVVSTFAGTGTAGNTGDGAAATAATLSGPFALSFGTNGSLLIADQVNGTIRRVDSTGKITTIAGNASALLIGDGSLATNGSLSAPSGVVSDAAGQVFISDRGNLRIRKVTSPVREMSEYRYAPSDYYFYTANEAEKQLLDGTSGWLRTGNKTLVNAANDTDTKALVRFYFDKLAQNKTRGLHFYSLFDSEIAQLTALNPSNAAVAGLPVNEGTVAYAYPPVNALCAENRFPVYRAFRNSTVAPDNATHRYTSDLALYNGLVAAGWSADGIAYCTTVAP